MSIHVALIDKSEIIYKMLSHCLYYHTVQVHRFDNFEGYLEKFNAIKPSLIFIDWEIKQAERPLIFTAIEQIHSVPFVLFYRKGLEEELLTVPKDQVSYRIKKPLNPKEIRDICAKLIPELKNSSLHSFLKFPKSKEEKNKPAPAPFKQKAQAEEKTASFMGKLVEKTGWFKTFSPEKTGLIKTASSKKTKSPSFQTASGLTSVHSLKSKKAAQVIQTGDSNKEKIKMPGTLLEETKPAPSKQTFNQDLGFLAKQLKDSESKAKNFSNTKSADFKTVKKDVKIINKDEIDIDEDTQNDLAPMAIKNSPEEEVKLELDALTKQDVQQAFDKYKDSLEFQKMLEKTLSEHTKTVVVQVLKGESINNILQESLGDFKQSAQFKQLVEKEVSQYLKTQLPLLIKKIVQEEIKKIIGD